MYRKNKNNKINLMSNQAGRQVTSPLDSLDIHHQEFNRSKLMYQNQPKQEHIYKNFYKQQLDEVLNQKNQYKSLQKQKLEQERRQYNERLRLGQQAERIKELSYKNYYQMIMNNQQNIKSKYVSPFEKRDHQKDKLINRGVQVGRARSQIDYEREIRRQQSVKKQFQSVLGQQMSLKQEMARKQQQERMKNNDYLKNVLLTPQEVEKLQRQRRLNEKNKYKQDLDKLVTYNHTLSQSRFENPELSPSKSNLKPHHHNILLNPVPFNIQNPYILKQMQKQNLLSSNPSFKSMPGQGPYNSPTKNNIFG